MEPTADQQNPTLTAPNSDGEAITVKKSEQNSAPTQIVINSVDGSIMSADDSGNDSVESQPSSASEISAEAPTETPVETTATNESEQTPEHIASTAQVSEPQPASVIEEAPQEEISSQPVETSDAEAIAPADQEVAPAQDVAGGTSAVTENPMAIPPQPAKKSGAPKAAVIVAVIIGVALMAGAVFAYMKSQQKPVTHSDAHTEQTTQTTTEPESTLSDEVDSAASEIDAEIEKTTGDKDIPASDSVNDQTLGL